MAIYSTPVVHPGREFERELWSGVVKPFHDTSTITSTTLLTVWDPAASKKFVLKGFSLTARVRVAFDTATTPRILMFWDGSVANGPICDAGMSFDAAASVDVFFSTPGVVWLREGVPSAAADRNLVLGFSETIGAGVLHVGGVVYGEELP